MTRAKRGAGFPAMRARNGFTLVEVMVATIVLSMGLVASASVMSGVARREMLSTSRIELMTVADGKMEELRGIATARTADTVQLTIGGSLAASLTHYADSVTTLDGRTYRRRWIVTAGPAGTRAVTVRVTPIVGQRVGTRRIDFSSLVNIL